MFGFGRKQKNQNDINADLLKKKITDAKSILDSAESNLNNASRFTLVSGRPKFVNNRINKLVLEGWNPINISSNSMYGYDGLSWVHILMENTQWDKDTHDTTQNDYDTKYNEWQQLKQDK